MFRAPFFSIVIPTLNEEKYLPRLLEDLNKQTLKDFEVIHIDGSSTDATVKEARQFKKKFPLRTNIVTKRNAAFQRNFGGKMAKGEWLIFMDADDRLPSYFLQGVRYQLDKYPDTGVFTNWVKVDNGAALDKTIENAINLGYEMFSHIRREQAAGALIGVRRAIFNEIQFQEKSQIFEDGFFVRECINAGHHFRIFREPRYVFSLRRVVKEGSLKMMRVTASAQLNYILGKKLEHFETHNHGYVMKGGTYYDDPYQSPLINLQHFIERASQKQLIKAKNLLKYLQEW